MEYSSRKGLPYVLEIERPSYSYTLIGVRALEERQRQPQPQPQSQTQKTQTIDLSALQFYLSEVLRVLEPRAWTILKLMY